MPLIAPSVLTTQLVTFNWEPGDNELDQDEGGIGSHSAEYSDYHELPSNAHSSSITFSAEKEKLFKVRYEEGYDLYDTVAQYSSS